MTEEVQAQSETAHRPPQVGPALKARRQALRMSLAQVEIATKIRGKFLTALEAGDYSSLPNDIYSRGFVAHYASHLGLDGQKVAADYALERGGVAAGDTKRPHLERTNRLVLTRQLAALGAALVVVAIVVGYLLWQFSALAAPPRLVLDSPSTDRSISGSVIEISGRTTPGSDVRVDDSPVLTDTDGNFREKVALQDGINAIRITSRSKLGKTSEITRNVLATLPKLESGVQAAVPTVVIPGVAVSIRVDQATSVVVIVDGKEAWRGTVVRGWTRVFSGANTVSLTTGNAGATSVVVTNSVAAGKKLSPLGRSGEIRRNQEFAKDTVIP